MGLAALGRARMSDEAIANGQWVDERLYNTKSTQYNKMNCDQSFSSVHNSVDLGKCHRPTLQLPGIPLDHHDAPNEQEIAQSQQNMPSFPYSAGSGSMLRVRTLSLCSLCV